MNCHYCHRELLSTINGRKYCNNYCRSKFYAKMTLSPTVTGRKCKICKEHFYPKNFRVLICSDSCRELSIINYKEKRIANIDTIPLPETSIDKTMAAIFERYAGNLYQAQL